MGESAVMKKEVPPGPDLPGRGTEKGRSARRPRAGLTLLILSGLFTLYIPVQLYWLTFVPGNFAFTGILFGGLLLACGLIGWFMPQYVRVLGVFGILLSILSLMGALGGMVIGMLLGIVGGCLCVAWDEEKETGRARTDGDTSDENVAIRESATG
ncbi:DUF6114 domain-containing protein [Kroppenstedtia eburnea]|uniref:Uncharacterized protein n=1 Tax=Kroppenstedtia eburnea TaxID=714067 RepID=A0A1N7PLR4_9BACL|nr:DUF6114 domain-containing protein [Kroppenstedtia eburnea]EGK11215.1 hypothetical protein HMPREF9374_2033 [Desmospora sp. 8437]QKI83248.1 hypothetical protein GXN75_15340 [Kroppenstedtia eburnea]SIT11430.1 hypothetical protein SAMN05421790_11337 [Kroppenstedtia eburnea]